MPEKFCLKWNDFSCNVSKSFGLFRNAEYLHDVTLVADDHKQVSAHKLVLSACSEYFRDVFIKNNNSNTHPLLCLDGISSSELDDILGYIYNGEIQIYQDKIDRFLSVAQRFKLEGLLSDQGESEDVIQPEAGNFHTRYENISYEEESPPKNNVNMVQENHKATKIHKTTSSTDVAIMEKVAVSTEDLDDIKVRTNELMERCDDGKYRCTLCGKMSNGTSAQSRQQIQYHIEAHHLEGISFPCQQCEKTFRSGYALKLKYQKYRLHK